MNGMRIDFIIKPEFHDKEALIRKYFEDNGYEIVYEKEKTLSKEEAEYWYERLKLTHPWYNDIVDYVSSDKCKLFLVEKDFENFKDIVMDMMLLKMNIRKQLNIKDMNDDYTVNVKTGIHTPDSIEEYDRDLEVFEVDF